MALQGNNFTDNQALSSGDSRTVSAQHEGAGGAVFFACADIEDSESIYREKPQYDYLGNYINSTDYNSTQPQCRVDVASNIFDGNYAQAKAGAIMWTNVNITESSPNKYVNNTSPNGQSVASPAKTITIGKWGMQSEQGFAETSRRSLQDLSKVVVSGQEIPIEISLFNAEGEVSKDDNSSVAILRFESVPEYGRLNGNQVIATNGVFNFTSFQVTMQPG